MNLKFYLKSLIALFVLSCSHLFGVTPVITGINPNKASTSGMTITGKLTQIQGTGLTNITDVKFGDISSPHIASFNLFTIAEIPPHSPLVVPVTATNNMGMTSAITIDSYFVYQGPWKAVVLNELSNDVSLFNVGTSNKNVITTPSANNPTIQAITPDGATSYVINSATNNISVIDVLTGAVLEKINVGITPTAIAITPDGKKAYVVNYGSSSISVIDTAEKSVSKTIEQGGNYPLNHPLAIAITADGTKAFVTNTGNDNVLVINTTTDVVQKSIPCAATPQLVITYSDDQAYVVVNGASTNNITIINTKTLEIQDVFSNINLAPNAISIAGINMYLLDTAKRLVRVIRIGDGSTIASIQLKPSVHPTSILTANNGGKAYITNAGGDSTDPDRNSIAIVNIELQPPTVTYIPLPSPQDFAVTPDEIILYIVSSDGTISILSIIEDKILSTFSLGTSSFSISITPDQAPLANFKFKPAAPTTTQNMLFVGETIQFDASLSASPTGNLRYFWSFGDNTFDMGQIVSHTFNAAKTYDVTLLVTNSAATAKGKRYNYSSHILNTTNIALGVKSQALTSNGGPTAVATRPVVIQEPGPTFAPLLLPPSNLKGYQVKNKFLAQTDFVNILTWETPLNGATPIAYYVYRNQSLTKQLGIVLANQELRFEDHNRKKGRTYTYYIVAVDSAGNVSDPAIVVVKGK